MWLWKPQQVIGSILSTVRDSLAGSEYGFPSAQKGHRVVGMGVLHPFDTFGSPVEGGKGKWETQDTAPSAPQIESLPAAPSATAPPLPRKAVESSGAAPSQEKAQLDTLVSLLAEAGANVPEPVRALVAEHQRSATQNLTRSLHRAVADQSRARAELQKLRANRSLFLEAWKGYIDQLTALLEAQLNDQEAALEKFNTAEIDWLASEREATIAIARMASKDQALSEEDQEMEDGEFRASEAAETEARLQKETEEHQSAGRHLHNALQVARQQAAEHLNRHQREGSRTPRRKNDAESEGQQVDKAKEDAAGKPSGGTATTPFKLGGSQAQAKPAPEAVEFSLAARLSERPLLEVQSEHGSLSQPVCPVGSTAFASRPVTGPFSHTAQDWVPDCVPVPLDTEGCQHHTSTRPVHPVGRTASAAPSAPIVLPGGMAPRPKATPLISDLQAMLASHVPLRPAWVSGPLLHMSPFEARWLAAFLPVEHDRRRFTVFDCRLDLMSRASDPAWSLLDYVTAAVRSVPYRVRLIWYIVRPIPDLPTPQFSVTAQDAPGGTRAIPVDLRGLGGMLHTIEVGPGPLRPLWVELRAKGVDPGSRLEQAWLDDLCEFRDEQGRRVDTITADDTSPEWLVLSQTDPLAPVHIEVDYVGGAGPVLRVPPPVPPPRGPCSTPASTTCTTTAVAVQPVTHHCQAVCLDEIAVLPEDLASPAERLLSMGAVPGLRYLLRERVPLQRHYTLFERAGNLHIRPLRPEWSLLDLVQDVMLVVPMLRSIQVLHSPLDRLPVLQVAATELGWPADSLAIPFDLRGAGLQICTLVVGPGLTQRILHEAVWTECAAGRSGVPDTVPFADSLGRTGDTRRPLADVQFFVPVYPAVWATDLAVTGLAADGTHSPTSPLSATSAPSCLGSTTTTTGAMQWAGVRISRQGVDQTAQYMLADHCQLAVFTAHSVEYGPFSPMGSPLAETLAPLLARILGRGHGPSMGFLQSSRVLPMNDNRVWLVPIIWAERTGTHVHVIFDARCAHGELQMLTLPRGTMAEQVLPYTLQSQGWALSVNGVAAPCIRRSLETGDMIFLSRPNKPVPGFHFGHAVLFMPHLRALTLPISLVDARPVPQQLTLAQTRDNSAIMRDELTRHINARIHLMGSAGPGLCPVTVMGMHHGPVMLYLPGPEPSLEHVQLVLDSIPEMPAGVRAFPCEAFPGEAPIFVTADPEAGTATAIIASTLGFGLDNLISVPLLPTQQHLGKAVYLAPGYVAEPFVRPPNGHYIRRTRVSLPGSGTSLACLDSGLDQTKNARLCSQARAKGIVSPRCPTSAQPQPTPLLPSEGRASIATPLGRRNLPILKPVADGDRHIGPDMVPSAKDPVEAAEMRDTLTAQPRVAAALVQLDLATLPLTAAPKSREELKRCIADLKRPWFGFWQTAWGQVPALESDACAWLYYNMDFWRPHYRVHLFTDGSLLKTDGREVCGWGLALAFEDLHTGGWTSGGFACGSLQSFLDRPVGASNTSFDAEIAACLVALLWSFCLPQGMEVILWHDCKSAGEILCGACSPQAAPSFVSLACRLRSVAVLAQQTGVKVKPQWIPSHSGIFFNDVVDAVAKAGARGDGCSLPLPAATWKLLESPFLPWAWLADYNGNAFPLFDRIADGVYEPSDEVPAELLPRTVEPSTVPVVAELSLKLVTCNVQTFKDKRNIVLQQLLDRKITIAGLQETRTTLDTRCNGADFFEFASAALQGEGGSSLFFSRRHPYGWREGRPLFFEASHFQCVHAEAQIIAVQVRAPHLQLLCVSAHAPHSGSPAVDKQRWWRQLAQASWLRGQQGRIAIFLDGNAQVGTVQSDAIGTHAADQETAAGVFMRDWADTFEVCFPATFCNADGACVPSAKEPTWFSPSGSGYRIDYVGVPGQWQKGVCSPSVLRDFELLNRDHVPAQVAVSLRISGRPSADRRPQPFPRDPGDWPEESIEKLRQCILSAPCLSWDLNVHQHVHCLIQAFHQFAALCRPPVRRRCRAFVSEPTRDLLEASKRCRRALRQLKSLHQALLGRTARGRQPVSSEGWTIDDVQLLRQWASDFLRFVQRGLRAAIAADKGSYVRRAQARLRDAHDPYNAKAFFAALKALRPPGKRVLKPFAGLIVDSEVPDDPLVRLRQQQKHFADLEAGTPADPSAFAACTLIVERGQHGFSMQHLPAWVDIETSFRACRAGKAPGPDGLPDWLWKLAPRKSAELWMPVFLKAHVRLCEPIQFKHTILCTLFKGKGSPAAIENHRAIALLAGPGKILRKQLRPAILRRLPNDPLHQGGIPHSLLQGAQHVVRAHASFAAALGISSSTLFLDVSSAYYRVLRQAFEDGLCNDTQVCQILQQLGVSPRSLHIVCEWLSGTNLMAGADEHEQLILRTYLSGSFFTLKQGGDVIRTRAGTRPGDSIADALFSLLQADFMAGLRQRMGDAGLLEDPITASSFGGPKLLAPIWADDTAVLLAHATAKGLLAKTQATLAFVHEEFTRRCMLPNYARGKSEVLLSPRGRGAPAVRQLVHIKQGGLLSFYPSSGPQHVFCVRRYVHLGGYVCDRPSHSLDVCQHVAQEVGAAVSCLFLAHIYGCYLGAFDQGRVDSLEVCQASGMAAPTAYLRVQRLMHFQRVCLTQPVLMDMLIAEASTSTSSWLGLLCDDVAWLKSLVPLPDGVLQDFPNALAEWCVHDRANYRSVLRKALTDVQSPLHEPEWWQSSPAQPDSSGGHHKCHRCEASFATFQALSAHLFARPLGKVHG
ncbi:hypothetical protein AK812_SmicGene34892 [Symbiodinium microadriaticum]|uniref:RNase H type-1 domain-containing protein n=1 Tax=Symbiodinium microadriaticum TaxID=2951 RepID=A0A1Q9CMV5_SYMMI|nr:hypothetical protein AK812_SmicGene34892 [Symbiodinium microadriaticum]